MAPSPNIFQNFQRAFCVLLATTFAHESTIPRPTMMASGLFDRQCRRVCDDGFLTESNVCLLN